MLWASFPSNKEADDTFVVAGSTLKDLIHVVGEISTHHRLASRRPCSFELLISAGHWLGFLLSRSLSKTSGFLNTIGSKVSVDHGTGAGDLSGPGTYSRECSLQEIVTSDRA